MYPLLVNKVDQMKLAASTDSFCSTDFTAFFFFFYSSPFISVWCCSFWQQYANELVDCQVGGLYHLVLDSGECSVTPPSTMHILMNLSALPVDSLGVH